MLTEGAHFNFPKMQLISHFPEMIAKYGSLSQYSTEICEASHKPMKAAYRLSNHINVMPQILDTYTRNHSFAMKELNIAQWSEDIEEFPADICKVLRPTPRGVHIPPGSPASSLSTQLKGLITPKKAYNLDSLANYFSLPDLQSLTADYMMNMSPDAAPDAGRLGHYPLEAYNTLQLPVPTFDNNGHIIHMIRCTGPELFRKKERRHDWVFVRRRKATNNKISGSLDGKVPARLNAIFKLRDPRVNSTYRLAHITLLKVIGSQTPDGPEGMPRVGNPTKNHVIQITDIEGMAHLIPIEPDNL